ncbi:septum formation initiator family protein [Timonella sp. A28]|uniref:FtsB family cell division protein n=1 Tax=Timonella sp. A28 TaxID=3442640 RepID=UPI003EC084BB
MPNSRPPSPRSSSGGSSRSSGRNTRPSSGQVPQAGSGNARGSQSGSGRRPAAPRTQRGGTPREASGGRTNPQESVKKQRESQADSRGRLSKQAAGGQQGSSTARPNQSPKRGAAKTAQQSNSRGSRSASGRGSNGAVPPVAQRQSNAKKPPAKSHTKNQGSRDSNVSAYAVGSPLNRNYGFLQTAGSRAVALVLVLGLCAVILTPVLRDFIKQYNELSELRTDIEEQQAHNDELRNELKRWEDEKFVIAQARERLTFVFPGETPYRVMGWHPEEIEVPQDKEPALFPDQKAPWYESVWNSVEKAGNLGQGEEADTPSDLEKESSEGSDTEPQQEK